jgi:uncharacterized protein YqiB (DUF1249 family)
MTEEAKVTLDGQELEVKDFSDQQKYLYNQMVDLRNKQGRLNFELDQINIFNLNWLICNFMCNC